MKSMSPAFSSSRHLKRMTETVKSKTEDFIQNALKPLIEKGESLEILCKELIHLTLAFICEAAFEYDISDDEKRKFARVVII